MRLKICKDGEKENFDMTLLETKFDYCRAVQGIMTNIVVRMIFQNIKQSAKYDVRCPNEAGEHQRYNQLLDASSIPSPSMITPLAKVRWWLNVVISGRIVGKKTLTRLFTYDVYGWTYDLEKFNSSKFVE